ncbi:SAGA complex subunit Spt20 [Schizosaccharomyces japonicus yFS275]|uniref:SAGA complex subunit Spt20 n=1 Tax=Schizosaccharomyces japonicus (strain yFS275 / FY16936) TaxID=402676 RepID=B6JYJ7_SCHJY|nr:SAGA complex subunit Spt20 [Schizosaccharomyces japonicus yFS275]EEB06615.1 SAGA complex subunit Spt20 [Schizosaccharomyces japonicus yFS275]
MSSMNQTNGADAYEYRYNGSEINVDDLNAAHTASGDKNESLTRLLKHIQGIKIDRNVQDILTKYANEPPSLILHIHNYHFRFEQQDGAFTYNGPVKSILHYLRMELIPPDCIEVFQTANIHFYDGCLIIRVIDHRTPNQPAPPTNAAGTTASSTAPGSVPSTPNTATAPSTVLSGSTAGPSAAAAAAAVEPPNEQAKVYHTVLQPSAETLWQDLCLISEVFGNYLTDEALLEIESKILLASEPPLLLAPATSPYQMHRIFEQLAQKLPPPYPEPRHTTNEMAAEEAERVEKENLLLLMDDQQHHDFNPTFQRLQFIENVRRKRALMQQRQQQQQQQQTQRTAQQKPGSRPLAPGAAGKGASPPVSSQQQQPHFVGPSSVAAGRRQASPSIKSETMDAAQARQMAALYQQQQNQYMKTMQAQAVHPSSSRQSMSPPAASNYMSSRNAPTSYGNNKYPRR